MFNIAKKCQINVCLKIHLKLLKVIYAKSEDITLKMFYRKIVISKKCSRGDSHQHVNEIWAASRKKRALSVIFDQNVYFCTFWMHIILRLICESLSRIAVKISYLWCRKHCVYAAVSFATIVTSWYLRNVMQNFTSIILYMNIIVTHSDYLVLIWKF